MAVLQFELTLTYLAMLAMLLLKVVAFVNALLQRPDAYPAASRGTKAAWTIGLGVGVLADLLLGGWGLIGLVFTVAALVYLLDVRPSLLEVTPRRR